MEKKINTLSKKHENIVNVVIEKKRNIREREIDFEFIYLFLR